MENFELNKNFDEIKYRLNQLFDKELFTYYNTLSLSYMGSALIDNSGFIPIFEQEKDKMNARIEFRYEPKTKYAVQEAAYKFMSGHSACENSPFNALKIDAYEMGNDYAQILRAGSILVRDYYLEKHPEIKD